MWNLQFYRSIYTLISKRGKLTYLDHEPMSNRWEWWQMLGQLLQCEPASMPDILKEFSVDVA